MILAAILFVLFFFGGLLFMCLTEPVDSRFYTKNDNNDI